MIKNNSNELTAPDEYWALSEEKRKELLNECGPDGPLNKLIPDHLAGLPIKKSCNIHDFMFSEAKNKKDYKEADKVFLKNMNKEIEKGTNNFFLKSVRKLFSLIYYAAVRGD